MFLHLRWPYWKEQETAVWSLSSLPLFLRPSAFLNMENSVLPTILSMKSQSAQPMNQSSFDQSIDSFREEEKWPKQSIPPSSRISKRYRNGFLRRLPFPMQLFGFRRWKIEGS